MAEENKPIVLTFGGGINARKRSADIDIEECTEGENFNLDFQTSVLSPRQGLILRAIAPNNEPIRGIAQLITSDGTISTIVQAGATVFSWDGTADGFTEVGTVSPDARLRGPIDSNFTLDNFIIITDLSKIENVKKWNGTTFQDLEHNLGVDFKAKYVTVQTERAIFANVKTGTVDTPHVLLASEQGDSEVLTDAIRPASAISAEDPWFLPTPDLRPINGVVFFAKNLLFSTERGRLYVLTGLIAGSDSDGLPFTSIEDFHAGSAVSGDEAMVNIGNDVAMGLPGRIETLRGIIEFGDVETNDASWWIAPLIDGTFGKFVSTWKLVYDPTGQRVFCFPNNEDTAWVLHKHLLFGPNRQIGGKDLSPWSKWTTAAIDGLRVTAVGVIFDPTDSPALLASSPGGNFTNFSGPTAPTLFFGIGDQVGSLFSIKKSNPPEDFELSAWVAVGQGGKIAHSPDGITWTQQTSPTILPLQSVAYGNKLWVAVGQDGTVLTSPDGLEWTEESGFPTTKEFERVRFHNGVWTAVGGRAGQPEDGLIAQSLDNAKTWVERTIPNQLDTRVEDVAIDGDGLYLAAVEDTEFFATDHGRIFKSTDGGVTWVDDVILVEATGGMRSIEHDGSGLWVTGGADDVVMNVWSSADGSSWAKHDYPHPVFPIGRTNQIAADGKGNWVAVDSNGQIVTSPDGTVWSLALDLAVVLRTVAYNGRNLWVVAGNNGTLLTSPDSVTWTTRTSSFGTSQIKGVANNLVGS